MRYQFRGRAYDLGLGPCDVVSTADAKSLVLEYRAMLLKGVNPREYHRSGRRHSTAPPFAQCAADHLARVLPALKHPKSRQQAENGLRAYVLPVIGSMRVDEIRPPDVARCLEKIWLTHRETSRKVRSRIERILDAARAAGHVTGDNPATLAILESLLPQRPRRAVAHHKALPWPKLPGFIVKVVAKPTISAKALMWTILTAVRTSDTLGAQWDEIDEAGALWTIPPERTKTGKPHRVPLSSAARAVLETLSRESAFLFPAKSGKPLSNMAMLELVRDIKPGLTVHGFRSTAKDWCSENGIAHEVSEAMLGHAVAKSQTVAAYLRTDHLDARRDVMERYSAFCFGGEVSERRKQAKAGERDIVDVIFGLRKLGRKWQRYVAAEKDEE
jgi:integrase